MPTHYHFSERSSDGKAWERQEIGGLYIPIGREIIAIINSYLTDTGIGLYDIQCIGQERKWDGELSASCFSPSGDKYFWVGGADSIHMFDFDRCSGELANPKIISWPYATFFDSVPPISGIAVSPNSRFLYIASSIVVLQYDLFAADISSTVDTVAVWDGTYDPVSPFAANFF